ncbi:MAG: tetratricopeptide repeat protein [Proteobacteria bacterium]|nr:tetratricopeptide repeat protein [Pseudomonadota bacterium]
MKSFCRAAIASAVLAVACGPANPSAARQAKSLSPTALPPVGDAPYELADDGDLAEYRALYNALAEADPRRLTMRRELASEYARRIERALTDPERRYLAHRALLELLGLWSAVELARAGDHTEPLASQLRPYIGAAKNLRESFARSGGDRETTAALFFLALADPANQAIYLAEVDDIFAHADALSVAQYGAGAEHSRPIHILEEIVAAAPIGAAVDRLVAVYVTRQAAFDALFRRGGASPHLIRAHGDGVFRTSWHVVRVLASAHRLDEAVAAIQHLSGLGVSPHLRRRVERALAADATAGDWLALATVYADEVERKEAKKDRQDKLEASLAICRQGALRLAQNADLLVAAGKAARQLEQIPLAIELFEQALERDAQKRDAAEELAQLYHLRVGALAFRDRPLAAKKQLDRLEAFHAEAAERWPGAPLESDLAEAYAAMGRGMTGLGRLDEAERYLKKSFARRATVAALEQLGQIAFKQDRFKTAIGHFERALALPVKTPLDMYNQAKIARLAGDAYHALGKADRAAQKWNHAMSTWLKLDGTVELPAAFKGEMLVELGKMRWTLGDFDEAMTTFETAVDVDSDGADTHASVVSFLIVRGEYSRALDAYHRALGSHEIADYTKVYMSLWVLAEAQRTGQRSDPLAHDYLASRDGRLWYHELARFATGQTDLDELRKRATTRGRRAEFLYYSAVLDSDNKKPATIRKLLRGVLATDMVLFYEYEMAKYWLAEGFSPRRRAVR